MKTLSIPNRGATVALGVFFLATHMVGAVYTLRGIEPSGSFLLFWYVGSALVVAYWILADSRRLGVPGSVDQGWFLMTFWPISLPYHLIKTRRWKGIGTLAGLVALYLATYVLSLFFFYALRRASNGE